MPAFITAPGPPKLIPKGILSVGAVAHLLLEKFGMGRPVLKILKLISISCGVDISEGTVAGVMQKVRSMLVPLYEAILERVRQGDRLHADETGWKVYEHIKGKKNFKWWLWVFASCDAVVFVMDPTRSKKVPVRCLGKGAVPPARTLTVDMFRAYMGLEGVTLTHCWSHMRRYFVEAMQGYRKALDKWGGEWVERIAQMYHLDDERLSLMVGSEQYQKVQMQLCAHVQKMAETMREQMNDPLLHEKGKSVLYTMAAHWKQLTVFLEIPEVPLDNNEAERLLRTPVLGRKNFYGSGSVWSGELAAMAFSILATALKNGLNPLTYLKAYLGACAQSGGKAPELLDSFLPWKMSQEDREKLSAPASHAG